MYEGLFYIPKFTLNESLIETTGFPRSLRYSTSKAELNCSCSQPASGQRPDSVVLQTVQFSTSQVTHPLANCDGPKLTPPFLNNLFSVKFNRIVIVVFSLFSSCD